MAQSHSCKGSSSWASDCWGPLTGSPLSPVFPGGPASPCLPCNNISRRGIHLVSIQHPESCHYYLLFFSIYLHFLRVHPSCHLSPLSQAPPAGQHIDHLASDCLSLALEIFRRLNKTNAAARMQAPIHISYNQTGKTWRSLDSLETLFALLEANKTQGRLPSPKQRGWLMATVTSTPPLTYMLAGGKKVSTIMTCGLWRRQHQECVLTFSPGGPGGPTEPGCPSLPWRWRRQIDHTNKGWPWHDRESWWYRWMKMHYFGPKQCLKELTGAPMRPAAPGCPGGPGCPC